MKIRTSVILAVLLILSLTACSGRSVNGGNDGDVSRRGPSISSSESEASEVSEGDDVTSDYNSDSLFASQNNVESETVSKPASSKSGSEPALLDDSLIPKSVGTNVKMSDKPFDFTFKIEDKVYQLPMTVNDFLADGWTIKSDNTIIEARSWSKIKFENGSGKTVSLAVQNYTQRIMEAKYCYIVGIDYYISSYDDTNAKVTLVKNIQSGKSTDKDIKAVFGEPENLAKSGDDMVYQYQVDEEHSYSEYYTFYLADNVLTNFSVFNKVELPANFVEPPINEAVPEYVSSYKAPSELGDDILSGNLEIDGVVYSLPCPLSAFIDNGWKYEFISAEDKTDSVGSGSNAYVKLMKYGYEVSANLCNNTDFAIPIEYTHVESIEFVYNKAKDLGVKLPGGWSLASTDEQLSKDTTGAFKQRENDYFDIYRAAANEDDYSHYIDYYFVAEDKSFYSLSLKFLYEE